MANVMIFVYKKVKAQRFRTLGKRVSPHWMKIDEPTLQRDGELAPKENELNTREIWIHLATHRVISSSSSIQISAQVSLCGSTLNEPQRGYDDKLWIEQCHSYMCSAGRRFGTVHSCLPWWLFRYDSSIDDP